MDDRWRTEQGKLAMKVARNQSFLQSAIILFDANSFPRCKQFFLRPLARVWQGQVQRSKEAENYLFCACHGSGQVLVPVPDHWQFAPDQIMNMIQPSIITVPVKAMGWVVPWRKSSWLCMSQNRTTRWTESEIPDECYRDWIYAGGREYRF